MTDENIAIDEVLLKKSPKKFAADIEELVWDKDISYIEAIIHYCETNDLEIETVSELVSKNEVLKSHVEQEAEDLNFLEKKARLPI